jgi:ATP-dependent helicase/nuclease subunit A
MTEAIQSPNSPAFQVAIEAQANAANPARSAWVEANAGSGKTKVLIDRVARLLLRRPDGTAGAPPNSILCVTYTKAAANEMLSRLFSRLGDWAIADDDTLRDKLSKLEGRDASAYKDEDFKEARRLFARALETPGGLRIETIHAFCARILRRFPLEAGISPSFTEIEEAEADELWNKVLSERLIHAASANPEALTILAKATGGRGITAALDALKFKRQKISAFARGLGQTSEGDMQDRIISALSAPNETAAEIMARIMGRDLPRSELVRAVEELDATKRGKADDKLFDALCAILDETDPALQYQTYMNAIAGSKWDWPPKSNPYTAKVPAGGTVIDLFARDSRKGDPEGREITRMKAAQIDLAAAEAAERTIALMTLGLPMVAAYQAAKTERAALDFDDLIECTRRLLPQSSAAQWVLYKLDGGLTHLLLDEAQDTSPPQWALINALVKEFQAGLGSERPTEPRTQFTVGDPKQSIYSFQGADEIQFQKERTDFIAREQVITDQANLPEMAMSFRSTPEVLTFVDTVRAYAPLGESTLDLQPPVDADLKPHQPRRANQPGRVELWPLEMPTPSEAEEDDWTAPTDHLPANAPRRRLARNIAVKVREMIDRGETVWSEQADGTWARRPIQPEDVLILVRSRNELFESLIESLKQEQLPVAGADRLKLLENIGVQDCLNLIRFVLQPEDDLTLAEILRGPFCGLTDDDNHLFVLAHGRPKGEPLWNRLQTQAEPCFNLAKQFLNQVLIWRDLPAFDFLSAVLNTRSEGLNGWDRLIQRLGEPVRDPVRALLMGALGHDMSEPASLQAYLNEVEGQDTVLKRELGEPDGAIRVMTVHGAKGLQAPIVILPDTTGATKPTTDAVFFDDAGTPLYSPSSKLDSPAISILRDAANIASERESRRLLYVALTRASDRLIVAGAGLGNSNEGYSKSSWYRWCLIAMTALNGGDTSDLAPLEAPQNYGPDPVCLPAVDTQKVAQSPIPEWLKKPAFLPIPPMRLAAPSRLTEDRSAVMAPFGPDRSAALRRGRLIHSLLQTLPDITPSERENRGRYFLERAPEVTKAEIDEMLEVTLRTLDHPNFKRIFSPGGRNEAAIVGTLPNGQMVNGRVDRLIITDTEVLIIDYKNDRPAPPDVSEIGDAYVVQMAAYRAVMQALYPASTHKVRCALLYTDGPVLFELDGAAMTESLNRVKSRV